MTHLYILHEEKGGREIKLLNPLSCNGGLHGLFREDKGRGRDTRRCRDMRIGRDKDM